MKSKKRTKLIKKQKIVALLAIIAFAVVGTVIALRIFAASPAQLSLSSSAPSVNSGDTFTVTVSANTSEPITIAQAHLTFDPTKVSYVSTDYTGSPLVSDTPDITSGSGFVMLSRFTTPPYPTGNVLVARVTFRALATSGVMPITLDQSKSSLYSESDASNILASVSGTSVSITAPTTPTQGQSRLLLSASPTSLHQNDTFVVTVSANTSEPINVAQAYLTFDPAKVSYVSTDYTGSPLVTSTPDAVNGNGFVRIGRYTTSQYPTGDILVAKVTLKVLVDSGSVPVAIDQSKSALYSQNSSSDILTSVTGTSVTGSPVVTEDTTAPSAPSGLQVLSANSNQANLTWTAATDNVGVTGYQVFRGTEMIADKVTGTSYSSTNLTSGNNYTFTVKAVDAAGNISAASNEATVSIPTAEDTTAPSAPSGLTAQAASSIQVNLSWGASTDNNGVTQYVVYRDGQALADGREVTTLSYADMTAAAGTTYTYTVRAQDAKGNTSQASNEATIAMPTPIPPLTTDGDNDPPVVIPVNPTPVTNPPVVQQGTVIQPRTTSGSVKKTDYYVNGNYAGTSTGTNDPVNIDTSKLDPGTSTITAKNELLDGTKEEHSQTVIIEKPSIFERFGLPIVFGVGMLALGAVLLLGKMLLGHIVPFYKTI